MSGLSSRVIEPFRIAAFTLPLAVLALAGCSSSKGDEAGDPGAITGSAHDESDGNEPLTLNEFMGHVMQQNAMQFWDWQAFVSDETGQHTTFPKSDEDWASAESDALTVAQLAHMIQTDPLYRVDDPDWGDRARNLENAARQAAVAAETKDNDAFLKAGAQVDEACVSCHYRFAPHLEVPMPTSSEAARG